MKILLIGEYSGVHWTLAQGLRELGHHVTVVSNGDFWKGFDANIKLVRRSTSFIDSIGYLFKVLTKLPRMRGYDVVQIINPMFLELKAQHIRPIYRYLRRHNGKMILAGMGMDYYHVKASLETNIFPYIELKVNGQFRDIAENRAAVQDWIYGAKGPLNKMIAQDCDGICCGLYEYYESYCHDFPHKTFYMPLPVQSELPAERYSEGITDRVRVFIGIQKSRSEFKGTDILLRILDRIESEYPDRCQVMKVHNVPFQEYKRLMRQSDILIDQLYSVSPNMNSLLAMSQGLVVAGGAIPAAYQLLGEDSLRPVITLPCDEEEIYRTLKSAILNPDLLQQKKNQGICFVRKHHSPISVARRWSAHLSALQP